MKHLAKLLPFLKPYWKKSLLSLFLLVVVVLLDLTIPRLVQRIIDQGILAANLSEVTHTFLLMLAISALDTLFAIGNNNTSVQVGEAVARDLRAALFVKMQSFSFGNLDRLQTGQWMVRLASDTSVVQRLVQITLRIGTRAPLIMLGSVILMYRTSRSLAITILPLMLVAFLLILFFASRMGPLFLTLQQKLDRLNTVLQENIAGVRVVKAFVRAGHESRRFEMTNQDYTERNIRVMQFLSSMGPSLSACLNVAIVVVIWGGGIQTVSGQVTPGQLVAFINYLQTAMGPLLIMVNLANVWAAAIASAERVNEILDQQPEVQDAPQASPFPLDAPPQISFRNVSFRYNGSNDGMVLDGINLDIEAGQTVAILGATGSGKTTLLNLIPRFYDVKEGQVLIGGFDVRDLQQDSLLKQIAIVPQETILFSGSVRDNIRYGCPQASDEEVERAAKIAQAHDFILELPQGYDTHIEERGVNLSGGQKQRIAIARALLTRPSILLLDDSTSSVDVETEARIQSGLREWLEGRTCVMVAQRISTVLGADKIVVLDQGRIVAEGSHKELLLNNRLYQEIYTSQLGDAQEVEIQHV
ncbi:MAG: Lipid A export ATP-binding/permease protein MsbA [Anaerolineae bacterium]|jgi:ATP-binding cassette subfamily B protein|nr:MAG: Lipid A export ATP-binding/permease protein MsbA [Anaerolineae bacterium]